MPPFYCTEHPAYLPADGECYLSRVVNAVIDSPDWEDPGIVLIITYDENGGFFDHVKPCTSQEGNPDDEPWVTDGDQTGPIGGGFRVPTIIVSPWTAGGHLSSKIAKDAIFDHTSVIQYLEKLTNVQCANLPLPGWRRATFSSLCTLIDRSRTPVARSAINIASPAQVDIWRTDALARLYCGDKPLGPPWPLPTQVWPPLEQKCRLLPDKIELKCEDIARIRKAENLPDDAPVTYPFAFSFIAEGFEPGELNLGSFSPKNFRPLKPTVELTIPEKPEPFDVAVKVGDAVGDVLLSPVPQTFRFDCSLVFSGTWPKTPVSIHVGGRLTSRLTWVADDIKIQLAAAG